MTIDTFTPPVNPSYPLGEKPDARVITANFGDGYSQRAEDGLNARMTNYDLAWSQLSTTDADAIRDFLNPKLKTTPFLYTPPGADAPIQFLCTTFSRTFEGFNGYSISATFEQNFDLV